MSESLNYALVALTASAIATTVGSTMGSTIPDLFKGRVSSTLTEVMDAADPLVTGTVPGKATIHVTTLNPCNLSSAQPQR